MGNIPFFTHLFFDIIVDKAGEFMKKLWMVMILSMIFVSGCETKKVFVGEVYLTSERLESYLEFNESLMNTKEESTH